ncbi:MAG: hypothetical protein ACI9UV_001363 [Algoriphagus sp.]|jgi:hypothetical protein
MTPTRVIWLILIYNYPRTNPVNCNGLSNGFIRISDSIWFNLPNYLTQKPFWDYLSKAFSNLPW